MFAHIFKDSAASVKAWLKRVRAAKPSSPDDIAPMSPKDAKIIDMKPARPLGDPTKVLQISKALPDAEYVPYSEVPFYDKLNKLIGVDPLEDIAAYAKARSKFFYSLPEEEMGLKNLVVTQQVVNEDKIKQNIKEGHFGKGGGTDIFVVRYQGKNYVMDGHHRLIAAHLSGKKKAFAHIERRVLDLDTKKADALSALGVVRER